MVNAGMVNAVIVNDNDNYNSDMEIEEEDEGYVTPDDQNIPEMMTPPRLERHTNNNYLNIITPIPDLRQNERFMNMNAPYRLENLRRNLMNNFN